MNKKGLFCFLIIILLFVSIDSSFAIVLDDYAYSGDFENSTDIVVRPEGNFSICLRSNPSTGYEWNYSVEFGDVDFLNRTFMEDNSYLPATGIGGNEEFNFKLNHIGLSKLKFEYNRPWEDSSLCTKEYYIFIIN